MEKGKLVFTVFSIIMINLLVSLISAGIYFSELNNKYNLGDMIELNAKVDPIKEGYLLKTDLFCEGVKVIEFNNLPDENGDVKILLPLNFHTLNQMSGNCHFSGIYSGDTRNSGDFEISKKLIVTLSKDSFFISPGEEIIVSGSAERLNSEKINGEVEITIPLLKILVQENFDNKSKETDENVSEDQTEEQPVNSAGNYYGKVEGGEFSVVLSLRDDTPAGDYRIDVLVYEKVSGEKASDGTAIANLKVFQVLKNIDIVLNDQNFDPGSKIEFKVSLLDQTGITIDDEVSVIIRDDNSNRIFEKIVKSQETFSYNIPKNSTSGYYEIEAKGREMNKSQKFYINEKAIVSFELINETLIVTNIGNIPYNKDIEVELNGKPFIKEAKLGLGESKKFKLIGANEEYDIKISDGETELLKNKVMLTGRSVGVDTVNESGSMNLTSPIIWIFFIIILSIGVLFLLRNIFKKKSYAYFSDKFKKKKDTLEVKEEVKKESLKIDSHLKTPPKQAEQLLVLKGHKTRAVVIVLKIKNKISENSKKSLEKAIENVYEKKGAVYEQGDFIFIIFSPLITKSYKNEVDSAKAAEKIVLVLNEHNKKFSEKIDFGIGISSGEIINKIEDKKLKFTALGNFIIIAKRLAEASDKQILATKESYEKGISEFKAEKKKIAGGEVYEIKQVLDNEKNQKFIQDFLKRMGKDDKRNI